MWLAKRDRCQGEDSGAVILRHDNGISAHHVLIVSLQTKLDSISQSGVWKLNSCMRGVKGRIQVKVSTIAQNDIRLVMVCDGDAISWLSKSTPNFSYTKLKYGAFCLMIAPNGNSAHARSST